MQGILAICKWAGGDNAAGFKLNCTREIMREGMKASLCRQLDTIHKEGITMPGGRVIKVNLFECHDLAELCHIFDDKISTIGYAPRPRRKRPPSPPPPCKGLAHWQASPIRTFALTPTHAPPFPHARTARCSTRSRARRASPSKATR